MNLNLLKSKLLDYFEGESSGHDIFHAERVLKMAQIIAEKEGGDLEVISIAALVHDMYRPWETKTHKSHFGEEALEMMKKFLQEIYTDSDLIEKVLNLVRYHDVYDKSEIPNISIELKILQDADRLDALGAIGIARAFMFGGAHGSALYNPDEKLEFDKAFIDHPSHRTSIIAHFYEKLLKLKDEMNTKAGKAIAESRHKFMEDFLDQFFNDWKVEI